MVTGEKYKARTWQMKGSCRDRRVAQVIIDIKIDMDYIAVRGHLPHLTGAVQKHHMEVSINDDCPLSGGTSPPSMLLEYGSWIDGVHKSCLYAFHG